MAREILTLRPPPADERIAYGPGPEQFGELRLPDGRGPHPVVVYVHGGCWLSRWDLAHAGHACAALTEAGLATWSVEYRRLGETGGGWPTTLLDVARGADHLRAIAAAKRLDLDRVVAVGHSAGGHLALWLAARSRIPAGDPLHTPDPLPLRAAVSLAGLVDLRRAAELGLCGGATEALMGGRPDDVPERYASASPYELLPLGVAQVLVHGRRDELVPVAISERYHARARQLGDAVRLDVIDDASHFDLGHPSSPAFAAVRASVLSFV